jgi:hypothetical protein
MSRSSHRFYTTFKCELVARLGPERLRYTALGRSVMARPIVVLNCARFYEPGWIEENWPQLAARYQSPLTDPGP